VTAVRNAITRETVAIYASAPSFPHGVVDPIPDLSELAIKVRSARNSML
jgi:sphinganine-1-phosphate aldolase